MREEAEHDDHPDGEEDLVAQIRGADRIDERLEHAHVRYSGLMSTIEPPADSTTARTEPPAMTPVPFDAGRRITRAAPKSATTRCGMVRSTSGTSMTCFFASSRPLVIAPGTSSAFPRPAPT